MREREGLKSVLEHGPLYVMTYGVHLMQVWFVGSWDTPLKVIHTIMILYFISFIIMS